MRSKKKNKNLIVLLLCCFFVLVQPIFNCEAATLNVGQPMNEMTSDSPEEAVESQQLESLALPRIIAAAIRIFFSLIGAIFLGLIVFNGIKWTISGGNPEAIKKARSGIQRAVVGMIIALSAYAITDFVIDRFLDMRDIEKEVDSYQQAVREEAERQKIRNEAGPWDPQKWWGTGEDGSLRKTTEVDVDDYADNLRDPDQWKANDPASGRESGPMAEGAEAFLHWIFGDY